MPGIRMVRAQVLAHSIAAKSRGLLLPASVVIVGLFVLVVVGRRSAGPVDVTGRYVLENERARDEIDVKADSTYVHLYEFPGEKAEVDTGCWEADTAPELLITFRDFAMKAKREIDRNPDPRYGLWGRISQLFKEGEEPLDIALPRVGPLMNEFREIAFAHGPELEKALAHEVGKHRRTRYFW
ncbi:MAG: hypothetical protein NVSMB53_17090 [Gemmatimonadaceae bacterium]